MTSVHKTSMEAKYSGGTAPSCVFLNAAGTQHQHFMVSALEGRTFGSGTSQATASSLHLLRQYLVICCGLRRGGKTFLGCSDGFYTFY